MAPVLHLMAHPGLGASRVNAAMWTAAQAMAGVTRANLYAQYPRCDIDIATEQARLVAHDAIVLQVPLFWYPAPRF